MNESKEIASLCLLAWAISACSSGVVNIGEKPDAAVATGVVGTWDGYVEAYTFIDGSDRVRLQINGDGTGTIRFGDLPVWTVPTDPHVDFLTANHKASHNSSSTLGSWLSGYNYPLESIQITGARLRAAIWPMQPFDQWCNQQTPTPNERAGGYWCGPKCIYYDRRPTAEAGVDACYTFDSCPTNSSTLDQANVPVSCDWLGLCDVSGVCDCTADKCSLDTYLTYRARGVDATLGNDPTTLSGTLSLPEQNVELSHPLHLTRQ
jgi:hypothetical protein